MSDIIGFMLFKKSVLATLRMDWKGARLRSETPIRKLFNIIPGKDA